MKNWKIDLIFLTVMGALLATIGVICYHQGKASVFRSCEVPDVYGYHNAETPSVTTCPDKRQELIIERKGSYMGSYEYRCHCR